MQNTSNNAAIILLFALFALILGMAGANAQYNYDHVNVTTIVNITNAYPEILNLTVGLDNSNFTLSAGTQRTLYCNATIRDYNGFNDITLVNATLYYYLNSSDQADDNNEHYTNTSCTETSNDGQYLANYSCSFQLQYYAYNGTWDCNLTVTDSYNFTDSADNSTLIDPLYALNVTDLIDYGNLSVGETSENITATVTNFGNMDINISVLGYGLVEGDGVGLVCGLGDNISIENQRFSSNVATGWAGKTQLAATGQLMEDMVLKQTDDITQVTQETYWQLYVPPNPFGVCTGTVRFTAAAP